MKRVGPFGRSRHGVAPLMAGLAFFQPAPASAFRTIEDGPDVPDGARFRWHDGLLEYQVYEGSSASLGVQSVVDASRRAFTAWSATPCARVGAHFLGTSPLPAASGDGVNTIEIVETGWQDLGYPPESTGATDLLFERYTDSSWRIVEADILINAEHHAWRTGDVSLQDERSLLGVLTHEGGHALGLSHPCEPDGADGAPRCTARDAADAGLMYPFYDADQTEPRADDYAGICYLYPTGGAEGERAGGGTTWLPTGATCRESNQCEGGECLTGVDRTPVCTQRCGANLPACPDGWECDTIQDRSVCVSLEPAGGCALAPVSASSRASRQALAGLFAMGVLGILRGPRRRPGTRPSSTRE